MRKIAKGSIFQLLPRNARFYLTANLNIDDDTTVKDEKKYYTKLSPSMKSYIQPKRPFLIRTTTSLLKI